MSTQSFLYLLSGRISKLEFLDEVEELELVLDHYCVAWGVKVPPAKRQEIEAQPGGWDLFTGGGVTGVRRG